MLNYKATPCRERGWRVGDIFTVVSGAQFNHGSLVELVRDDGSYTPLFRLLGVDCLPDNTEMKLGAYTGVCNVVRLVEEPENYEAPALTPCEKRGWAVGDLFRVVKEGLFSPESVVSLFEDDGSVAPLFRLVSGYCSVSVACGSGAGAYAGINSVVRIGKSFKGVSSDE